MGLFRNITNTFLSTVLIFLVTIFSSIIIARSLGPDGQGIYALILLFPSLILFFTHFGLGRSIIYHLSKKEFEQKELTGTIFYMSLIMILASIIIGFLICVFFKDIILPGIPYNLLIYAIILIPMQILFLQILSAFLFGVEQIREFNITNIFQIILFLLFILTFLVFFDMGIIGALIANILSLLFAIILRAFFIAKSPKLKFSWSFNTKISKKLFYFGLKVHLGNLMNFFRSRIDVFILNFFLLPASVGFYSIAYGLAEILWMLSTSASNVLGPRITAINNEEEKKLLTPLISRNVFLITIIGAIFLYFISAWLVDLLYSIEYQNSIEPLKILLIGIVAVSVERVLSSDIISRGKPMITTYTTSITVIIDVILCIILIPSKGVAGAAWASSIAYSFNLIITTFFYVKISKNPVKDIFIPKKSDLKLYWNVLTNFKDLFKNKIN